MVQNGKSDEYIPIIEIFFANECFLLNYDKVKKKGNCVRLNRAYCLDITNSTKNSSGPHLYLHLFRKSSIIIVCQNTLFR